MDADAALDQPITLVAIGGDPAAPFVPPRSLPACSVVVAADSGLDQLVRHGIAAHHVVGDLDSVAASSLERARRDGARIHAHPSDKDATDLELALDLVLALAINGLAIGVLLRPTWRAEDVILVATLLGVVGTLAVARFVERRGS